MKLALKSENIVLKDRVFSGYVLLEDGKIVDITSCLEGKEYQIYDYQESYIIPGIIKLKSNAFFNAYNAFKNNLKGDMMAFYEVDKRAASYGITTLYNSITLEKGRKKDDFKTSTRALEFLNKIKTDETMINHKIHLKYELTYQEGIDKTKDLLEHNMIDYISYLGYRQGNEQSIRECYYTEYVQRAMGIKEEQCRRMVERIRNLKAEFKLEEFAYLVKYAKYKGINVAFSDEEAAYKISTFLNKGISLLEDPKDMEKAKLAKEKGILVALDSSSIIKEDDGETKKALRDGIIDILTTEKEAPELLVTAFYLEEEGLLELFKAISMITIAPAKAVGIDKYAGSIEAGKDADLVVVEKNINNYPIVRATFVKGKLVYTSKAK